jgi:hypothetical protein
MNLVSLLPHLVLPKHPELKSQPIVQYSPLKTRDALYGGRTEDMRLHYKIWEGEETIQYVDVTSLYPYVCKYFKFPIGHPTIHVGEACLDVDAMLKKEGLIKCLILPPERLYHPVLPFRCNSKLLFCLCKTCALEQNTHSECTHESVEESYSRHMGSGRGQASCGERLTHTPSPRSVRVSSHTI